MQRSTQRWLKLINFIAGILIVLQISILIYIQINNIYPYSSTGSRFFTATSLLNACIFALLVLKKYVKQSSRSDEKSKSSFRIYGFLLLFPLVVAFEFAQYDLIPRIIPSKWFQYELIGIFVISIVAAFKGICYELHRIYERIKEDDSKENYPDKE